MSSPRKLSLSIWTIAAAFLVIGGLALGIARFSKHDAAPRVMASENAPSHQQEPQNETTPIQVVHPKKGFLERLSTQPGSIQAYESIRLFAKVPGFLKEQKVDIGDRVKKGDVLAVVDVPELQAQRKRNRAAIRQAGARVLQMKARVSSAMADLDAANAGVTKAIASQKSAAAWVRYRKMQLQRMSDLFVIKSIEERLVDESKEHYEASVETELAAQENVTAAKAIVVASQAKIAQAKADVDEAKAEVEVADAELEMTEVRIGFATLVAPFDGVITQRRFFPGDYIRSANEGGGNEPLLTVERSDLYRVVVQIPDRDVPFTDPGDKAYIQIDALPGQKLAAKVSRIASYEDPQTRLMRVEIDLPNPTGRIRQGMYGQVTIVLDQEKDLFSIPSSCLVAKTDGKGTVYVIRNGHARKVDIRIGADNGLRVGVLGGLTDADQVILNPSNSISDGAEVTAALEK